MIWPQTRIVFCALWVAIATGFVEPLNADDYSATYEKIAVAADHPAASAAGLEVSRAGGNVVDVAAAVGFALSVVRPESAGLGGGGFMVIWIAESQTAVAIDYRERAPAAATRDMFLGRDGKPISADSRTGHRAAAVPHHVAGLCHAVETYGRLKISKVIAPALRLATEGVPLDHHSAQMIANTQRLFEKSPEYQTRFPTFWNTYLHAGRKLRPGDIVTSPQAPLLREIAARGHAGFYEGVTAENLAAEMQRGGGLITVEDLHSAAATERRPLRTPYGDGELISMPPPSSGGVALYEILNTLAAYERLHPTLAPALQQANSVPFRQALAESMKHAFADRAEFLGDPDAADIPVQWLVSRRNAAQLAEKINPEGVLPLTEYGRIAPVADAGTTHFSIMDAAGNAVACTETINLGYGSYVVVPETGLLLNNEMDDFAAQPGVPNAFGLVQGETAAIGPGRRPLSSMCPTLLIREGKAVIAVGASGGPRIISATAQTLLNVTRFGMTPSQAITAPREHHQWLPDELLLEPDAWPTSEGLRDRGQNVVKSTGLGVAQIVVRQESELVAACDPRKGGQPAGE